MSGLQRMVFKLTLILAAVSMAACSSQPAVTETQADAGVQKVAAVTPKQQRYIKSSCDVASAGEQYQQWLGQTIEAKTLWTVENKVPSPYLVYTLQGVSDDGLVVHMHNFSMRDAVVPMMYYSGHLSQVEGRTILNPCSADIRLLP